MTNFLLRTVLLVLGLYSITLLTEGANATVLLNCAVDLEPKGVAARNANSIWVAIDSGELHQFTNLPNGCNKNTITVNNDPHLLNETSTGLVAFTNHISNKVSYYDINSGNTISCSNSVFNEPDAITTFSGAQYFTNYLSGYVAKSVKGTSTCTITSYLVPGTNPRPEGIAASTGINGLFVVDQNNNKLYTFNPSTGNFQLCVNFGVGHVPWYAAVSDSSSIIWVTFNAEKTIRAVGTLSCLVAETDARAPGSPFDVALTSDQISPRITFSDSSIVSKFDESSKSWSNDYWSNYCGANCYGFGIDTDIASGVYYAAMRSGFPSDMLAVGIEGCGPPSTGDWDVTSGCGIVVNQYAPANVIVENGVVLTITSGTALNIDFTHYHLLVKAGGKVLIQSGGKIS
jgi:hypothetical protein